MSPAPSFLLCHLPAAGPAADTVVARARTRELHLRNAAPMSVHLGDRCVRLAVKDPATNRRMVEILREVLAGDPSRCDSSWSH